MRFGRFMGGKADLVFGALWRLLWYVVLWFLGVSKPQRIIVKTVDVAVIATKPAPNAPGTAVSFVGGFGICARRLLGFLGRC